ncbi:MAG: hypothetical protein HKO02_12645 [Hyphomonadaceae bacterium]|nr:hypothetical protein [Hyphomonadaceae bacterium]
MATRKSRTGYEFDHGAPFFTVHSPSFLNTTQTGNWANHVGVWDVNDPDKQVPYFVGEPMMKSPIEALAAKLKISLNARITKIHRTNGKWGLTIEHNDHKDIYDMVVVAAPAFQVHQLTRFSKRLTGQLSQVNMTPCWALLVSVNTPAHHRGPVFVPKTGPISFIARNSSKAGRDSKRDVWVAHASPAWSQTNLELDPEDAISHLHPVLNSIIGSSEANPPYISAHRWRYANVAQAAGTPFLKDETASLFAAGDWCLGPGVEHAFASGEAVAQSILST